MLTQSYTFIHTHTHIQAQTYTLTLTHKDTNTNTHTQRNERQLERSILGWYEWGSAGQREGRPLHETPTKTARSWTGLRACKLQSASIKASIAAVCPSQILFPRDIARWLECFPPTPPVWVRSPAPGWEPSADLINLLPPGRATREQHEWGWDQTLPRSSLSLPFRPEV